MRAMPDYGGYGASWRRSTYREVPVGVPEILLKVAGPRSTAKRQWRGSFAGLGENLINPENVLTPPPVNLPENYTAPLDDRNARTIPYTDPATGKSGFISQVQLEFLAKMKATQQPNAGPVMQYYDLNTGQPIEPPHDLSMMAAAGLSPDMGSRVSITGGPEIYIPREGTNAVGDSVFTLPEDEQTIAHVEVTGQPIDDMAPPVAQPETNWWMLLLIAAGIYLITKGD